ncbi:hypothetical protein ACBI99_22635 [Nonomuraea sp. ATR24]|uniref:hypothetical protein n=1 Tax=Nonomuraea sp. ATR24 TaxID=1676744 RepID=UPI0035C0FB1B
MGTGRPSDTVDVPAEFAGTWTGTVDGEAAGKQFENEPVTLILRAGEPTGVWDSPSDGQSDPGCGKGTLYATEVKDSTLHLTLADLGGVCAYLGGTGSVKVTLELKDDDQADYELTMPVGRSEGELTKTG